MSKKVDGNKRDDLGYWVNTFKHKRTRAAAIACLVRDYQTEVAAATNLSTIFAHPPAGNTSK